MIKCSLSLVLIVMTTITALVPDAAQFEKLRAAQRARALLELRGERLHLPLLHRPHGTEPPNLRDVALGLGLR